MQDRSIREPPRPATFELKPITNSGENPVIWHGRARWVGIWAGQGTRGEGGSLGTFFAERLGALTSQHRNPRRCRVPHSVVFGFGMFESLAEVGEGDSALRVHFEFFREAAEGAEQLVAQLGP